MINLSKFSQSVEAKVPIIKNSFIYNRKKYKVNNINDGWYAVNLKDNEATIINEIIPEVDLTISKKQIIKGYTYNNNFLFFNFSEGKRRTGWEMMSPLRLNNISSFSSIEAIIWEDGFLYSYRQSYTDTFIFELKNMYEEGMPIHDKKNITPEQKSLYLFHSLEREQQRALIRRLEEERLIRERKLQLKVQIEEEQAKRKRESQSVEQALVNAFSSVGASIINFQIRQDRIYVEWEINGEDFNSVVDKNTFKIVEAGFCMSGDDKRHNVKSMIITAQDYMDRRVLHKW